MLPGLLVVAPVTARFAFARIRLASGGWESAYRLTSGHQWWRCLRLAASRGELHPCAQRLAKHLSWHLGQQVTLTGIRGLLAGYAAYHYLSVRTAWTDWGRLVAAGWLAPTRAPANQGPRRPQEPGSGRTARYVLTAPAGLVAELRSRPRRQQVTALDTSSSIEASPSPSVPPPRQHHQRGWITICSPTPTERRDASALLAGCHERWRHQRPDHALLTRTSWQQLLPLVAQVQAHRPDVALSVVLTDRVRSARHLPNLLAWRLWQLLHQPHQQDTRPQQPPHQPTPPDHAEDTDDWRRHHTMVHTLGGPAAARAALATAGHQPPHRRPTPPNPPNTPTTTGKPGALHLPAGTMPTYNRADQGEADQGRFSAPHPGGAGPEAVASDGLSTES